MSHGRDLMLLAFGVAIGCYWTYDYMKAGESAAYLRGVDEGETVKAGELEEAAEEAAYELCHPSDPSRYFGPGPGKVHYI